MRRALAASASLAIAFAPELARADCAPPFCFQTQVTPPPVVVQPPPVVVQPPPVVVQPPPVPSAEVESARVGAWHAYFEWMASIRASASASATARIQAEAHLWAEASADPYLARGRGGGSGANPDYAIAYPRAVAGLLAGTVTTWSGTFRPLDAGFRPSLRYEFDDTWGLALDASLDFSSHERGAQDALTWTSLGLHPAATYALFRGGGHLAASSFYALAGLDVWGPTSGGAAVPDAFFGAHAGFGAYFEAGSPLGFSLELFGSSRFGSNVITDSPDGIARIRAGFTMRVSAVSWSFDL